MKYFLDHLEKLGQPVSPTHLSYTCIHYCWWSNSQNEKRSEAITLSPHISPSLWDVRVCYQRRPDLLLTKERETDFSLCSLLAVQRNEECVTLYLWLASWWWLHWWLSSAAWPFDVTASRMSGILLWHTTHTHTRRERETNSALHTYTSLWEDVFLTGIFLTDSTTSSVKMYW